MKCDTFNRLSLFIFFIVFICQGCTSHFSTSPQPHSAQLVDLTNGTCRQSNGLIWQTGRSKKFSSFEDARLYAENLQLAGHDDWRLPTKEELFRLSELFDLRRSGDCPMKPEGSYWNAKKKAGEWYPYPLCGGSDFKYLKSKTGRVRAVRP